MQCPTGRFHWASLEGQKWLNELNQKVGRRIEEQSKEENEDKKAEKEEEEADAASITADKSVSRRVRAENNNNNKRPNFKWKMTPRRFLSWW